MTRKLYTSRLEILTNHGVEKKTHASFTIYIKMRKFQICYFISLFFIDSFLMIFKQTTQMTTMFYVDWSFLTGPSRNSVNLRGYSERNKIKWNSLTPDWLRMHQSQCARIIKALEITLLNKIKYQTFFHTFHSLLFHGWIAKITNFGEIHESVWSNYLNGNLLKKKNKVSSIAIKVPRDFEQILAFLAP